MSARKLYRSLVACGRIQAFFDLAQGYFAQLKNTPYKRLIELSEGTHTVMMEKNRMQFFRELMGFLDEEKPLALK